MLFKWGVNLEVLLVSSTSPPFLRTGDGRSLGPGLLSRHPKRLSMHDTHV